MALPRRLLPGSPVRARLAGVLDALLSGRGWIALVAVLLAGIVFFNVDLLQLNREITRTAERSSELKRENAGLRLELARLASSERIQLAAQRRGFVLPLPGEVAFLRSRPSRDARLAVGRITAPGETPTPAAPVQPQAPPTAPAPAPTPAAPPQAPLAVQPTQPAAPPDG